MKDCLLISTYSWMATKLKTLAKIIRYVSLKIVTTIYKQYYYIIKISHGTMRYTKFILAPRATRLEQKELRASS